MRGLASLRSEGGHLPAGMVVSMGQHDAQFQQHTQTGETRAVAGLWGRWTRVRHGSEMRVESFAVFTVQDKTDRWVPLEVEAWDWHAWLEGKLDLEMLIGMPPVL